MKKFRKILIGICALFFINIFVTSLAFFWEEDNYERPEGRFDSAIIFMGGFNADYTWLDDETLRRVNYALKLYNDGLFKNIVCIGGARPKIDVYGSKYMREVLLQSGVSPENVFVETESFDSVTNWAAATKIIKNKEWKDVALISSPFHLKRMNRVVLTDSWSKINLRLAPYSYRLTPPKSNAVFIWKQINYQWLSELAYRVLPSSFYDKLLHSQRLQR